MVISEAAQGRIGDAIARYPEKRGALLPALHIVQEELGCIPLDAARELATLFEMAPVEVMEILTFYNMFRSQPGGRHHVFVCTNLTCSLRGARGLLRQLEAHLGVSVGETTEDGRITLGHEECLGACAYAPMLRVDATYHENLDAEEAKRILDGLE
jgi:NADH-quinone oxidoreductase subunit E